ncbi:hypothetical protein AGABI2DRAFT_195499 [Agaricus bisporus var. bisporus H97]|uniref:hypothetical protein n=1 Tax=Agaricus bisporus var. bisporus (strain H97 / ATCC MYA-4626 / FGSC 10389) TaxID=936046 RepID=UPI00029F4EAA|nr:hypothetical protein AGABI2DRAFT_195499 [Agaricus bisporus var. bisporus H97]EKV42652.1 hypothetical protein AGABI2DRAFT_195499 [Agaricus bisporus var. bisporus H97]
MVIKLYSHPRSPSGKIVSMVLYEKGTPFEFIKVDFATRQQKTPEYLAMNPFGVVPCIDDNGFILYESRAIARYLEENYPGGPGLIPSDPKQRALFDQASASEASNFDHYCSPLVFEAVVKKRLNLEPDPLLYKELSDNLNATLDVYDQILAKQKYIAGDSLTLADLYHIPVAVLLSYADIDITRGRPNVKRWFDEISSRPSWQKAKEGLDT